MPQDSLRQKKEAAYRNAIYLSRYTLLFSNYTEFRMQGLLAHRAFNQD